MTEVREFPKAKRASKRPKSVTVRLMATNAGGHARILAVDANSPSLGDDLLYVFSKNVQRARKENRDLLVARPDKPKS
jgi:hypothetical protein